ncbi:TadE/TadG family type IV pilus assembly protein [Streptomyces mutabilis]|uniref:Septum formation initiator n=1 Tax=Streptomyces mutabilis TaxID=67332 RepID=A0A086MYI6_9ACTN|nr:TadE/TadG family type IV pilus assembly protein [Streptomyces mutabilis]KFG73954.1 septum formation initiator [Streptomyces mutabilis]
MRSVEGERGPALRGRLRDSGQVTVEFLGMLPAIIVTLVVLWQLVLVGYTFTLAGNAADEAVRAATAAERGARQGACEEAGRDKLPGAWEGGAGVDCGTAGGFVTADVEIRVPILFPGTVSFPFDVRGHAGAVEEETD